MNDLRVAIVSIPVADQNRARDFYRDKLGFKVVIEKPMGPSQSWIQLVGPDGGATITLVTWFDTMPAGSLRGLVVETGDIDAAQQRLRAAGVDIDDVKSEPWGRYASLRDSEGNGLVLMTPMGR
jgi:catechol 2,3-dioxygenase-like lactoylglutathione lyase family enzyme